jgi:HK97 gp10 family phage protein
MGASASLKFSGGAELVAKLKGLSEGVQKRQARLSLAAGAEPIRKQAQANASALGLRKTGALIKNIARKHEKQTQPGYNEIAIGVRHGQRSDVKRRLRAKGASAETIAAKAREADDPFYWRFAEFGTSKQRATPFIRPAFEAKKQDALDALAARLKRGIETELKK